MAKVKRKSKDDMACNKPSKSWRAGKKKVVKACAKGKEKIVHFGDSSMKDFTQHKSEKRKKSYCARSGGIKGGDGKLSANYWSRKKLWSC